MIRWMVYAMIYLGSALMVYNIYGFVSYARQIQKQKTWDKKDRILYIPIVLLVLFLLGYLAVGLFGNPDLIMAGILFGGSIFVFVVYHLLNNITKRMIENEHLEAELMAAEESSRAKSSFLASISHEMRTPMNVILGLDEIALRNPHLQSETREQLEKIGQSGRHLLGLINNILDMNRIETGEYTIKNEAFSLNEVLEQINAIVNTLCEEKGLSYQVSMQESAAGDYLGDALQLKQVLLSILDNAVKYTDAPGTVAFSTHRLSSDEDISTLQFTVTDTGTGISSEFLPKVFEPLTQEDASATNRYGGSGLSLAVTKKMMDRMGGSIAVSSEKNVGTAFTVTLPLKRVEREAQAPQPQPQESLDGRRILIVDDRTENAEIVADILELEGACSEHAPNGQIAVDMIQSSSQDYFDAVLMDLRMPVMDGLEAARRIRSLDRPDVKTVPIIALSANAFQSDVQQALDAGMNMHLVKPVDAGKLYAALRQLIRK